MSSLVLMENAGRGVADVLCQLGVAGPIVICCGHGNNAGDGFVVARHLDLRGKPVQVLLLGAPARLAGDARANYEILSKCRVPLTDLASPFESRCFEAELAGADWIVDALLGTGARGEPLPPLDAAIDVLNAQPARKLAIDVPTGLDCDTGQAAAHTFRADHTCTFVAAKPGFYATGAEALTGTIHVLDIGAPRKLMEQVLAGK